MFKESSQRTNNSKNEITSTYHLKVIRWQVSPSNQLKTNETSLLFSVITKFVNLIIIEFELIV